MIWQIYTEVNEIEIAMLQKTARANGFVAFEVVPEDRNGYTEEDDTFPGWRTSSVWLERVAKEAPELLTLPSYDRKENL
jgi:hypothetical protein